MKHVSRIGILTAGGDCPGLNAVIRAVAKEMLSSGLQVVGIEDGMLGLIENRCRPLGYEDVSGILTLGGTILGTSNKANPTHFAIGKDEKGELMFRDVSERCLRTLDHHGIHAVVVIGGDGSMSAAEQLRQAALKHSIDLNFIGVPKTIDNDLYGSELTFGFQTAVDTAADALDKVHTTAASHHRVLVVEVMGRNAGWLALHAGVASGADAILLPEIPFTFKHLNDHVTYRSQHGERFSIVCVAEGARPEGGEQVVARRDPSSPDPIRLGGVGKFVADRIEADTGLEARYVVLGHVQRGGSPVASDRVLATMLGHRAAQIIKSGGRNRTVVVQGGQLRDVELAFCAGKQRLVQPDEPLIAAARAVRTSFGDA